MGRKNKHSHGTQALSLDLGVDGGGQRRLGGGIGVEACAVPSAATHVNGNSSEMRLYTLGLSQTLSKQFGAQIL